ncbi:O-antigen polymerase [Holdemania massiliensis]|uniref:O-antigen ligase-related domain-containing protein n=1 Tax=Holdemania massiliensis TaxID=1468449 RepID=A0A6N7S481_9FIRM|nr:O-antigen polymerase [Holdemania massiliensis]MSA70572.1 hypothetical protein [Holdemania massiliensis]MSA88445.1 hypothetical protein [Holdemania massiliensis]MSB77655.1 hypothetical protein [Holdemania massiliensis]MSC32581.1 hypothetical protein [Holdemania massiliensis]MSC38901.1 hypothetical protein [Holdemania massiliensis]
MGRINIVNNAKLRVSCTSLENLSFVLFFSADFLRLILGALLARIDGSSFLFPVTWGIIYLPLIFSTIIRLSNKKKVNITFIVILILVIGYVFISLELHPNYLDWYLREDYGIWDTVFRPDKGGIYGFLFFSLCHDENRLYKNFKFIAFMCFLFVGYQYFQFLNLGYWLDINAMGMSVESSYGLTFGYNASFVACMFFMFYIKEKKFLYFLLGIISSMLMILQGSRGAIIVLMFFLLLNYVRKLISKGLVKAFLFTMILLILIIFLAMNLSSILSWLSVKLTNVNLSSRTIDAILNNTLFDDNGRSAIQSLVQEKIQNGPFFGFGIFGDRPLVGPYYYWGYCHNLLLEFQVDFGKYPGFLFFFILVILSMKVYFKNINNNIDKFLIFILIISFTSKLFLSSTFWGDKYFWSFLALILYWNNSEKKTGLRHAFIKKRSESI